jgi:hypothetical protein
VRTVSGSVGALARLAGWAADGPERLTGDGAPGVFDSAGAVFSVGAVRDDARAAPAAAAPTAAAPTAAAPAVAAAEPAPGPCPLDTVPERLSAEPPRAATDPFGEP